MSYDIELTDTGLVEEILELDGVTNFRQGTFPLGGSNKCSLNMTYNYSVVLYDKFDNRDGIMWLHNKIASDTISRIEDTIANLKDDVVIDYWQPTEGNVKQALCVLLMFAKIHPEGIWRVY